MPATGSFHSSLETLSGEQNFEITVHGALPEELVGQLTSAPYIWRVTFRMEDFAFHCRRQENSSLLVST